MKAFANYRSHANYPSRPTCPSSNSTEWKREATWRDFNSTGLAAASSRNSKWGRKMHDGKNWFSFQKEVTESKRNA